MTLSFNQIRELYLPKLDQILSDFLKKSGFRHISEMSVYHLESGGKRIRGLIPAYIFSQFGQDPQNALHLGAAIEIIHNATLVHDDLQDGDEFRRNRPTVWKKYSEAQAINCGDGLFQFAFLLLNQAPVDPACLMRLTQRMAQATLAVIEGQAQEFLMKEEPFPGMNRYLEVVQGKTSGLLSLPFVCALDQLGIPEEVLQIVKLHADQLGIIFQIHDDHLDLYGNKGRNQVATDIAEGKVSALVAVFNDLAPLNERNRLAEILGKARLQTTQEDIDEALALFQRHRVKERAEEKMDQLITGISKESRLSSYPQIRSILLEFAEQFAAR